MRGPDSGRFLARAYARETGRMWIHDAMFGGERVHVATLWNADQPDGTRLSVDAELARGYDLENEAAQLAPLVRETAMELAKQALSLRVGPGTIEVVLRAPLADPSTLEPLIERMSSLGRALRGELTGGPFR